MLKSHKGYGKCGKPTNGNLGAGAKKLGKVSPKLGGSGKGMKIGKK